MHYLRKLEILSHEFCSVKMYWTEYLKLKITFT